MGHAAQPRTGDFDDTSGAADPDDTDAVDDAEATTDDPQPEAPVPLGAPRPTVDVLALPDLPGSEGAVSTDYDRPATYRDCMAGGTNAARPCPWLSCTEHAIHALPTSHPVALVLRIPAPAEAGEGGDDDPRADRVLAWLGKAPYSCTIDATQDALTLETAGSVYGVTRERVRQMESSALRDLRTRARGPGEATPAEGIRHAPATGFAQRMESRALLRTMRDDVFSPDTGPATSPPQRHRTTARVANEGTLRDSPPPTMYAGLGHPTAMSAPEDRAWCPTLRAPVTGKLCVSRHTARDRTGHLSSDPKGAFLYATCAKCEWAARMVARFPVTTTAREAPRVRLPVVYGGVGATGAAGGFTAPGIAPPEPRPGCAVEGCNDPTRAEAPGGDTPAYLHGLCVLHTRALAVRRGSTYGVSIPVMALREYLITHGAMGGVSAWWRAKERAAVDTANTDPPPRSTPAPPRAPAVPVTRTHDPEPPVPIPPTAFAPALPPAPAPTPTPDATTPTGNPECTAIHCNSPAHVHFRGDPQRLKELCKYHIGRAQDVLAKRAGSTPQTVLAYIRDNGSTVGIVEHLRACGEIPGVAGDATTRRREAMANARAVKAQRHATGIPFTPAQPQGFPGGEPITAYAVPAPHNHVATPQPTPEAPADALRVTTPAGTGPAVLKGSLTGRVGPMTLGVTVELDPEAAALLRVGSRMGLARATRLLEGMETLAALNAAAGPGTR